MFESRTAHQNFLSLPQPVPQGVIESRRACRAQLRRLILTRLLNTTWRSCGARRRQHQAFRKSGLKSHGFPPLEASSF